jgi:hypothetical protein
MNFKTGHDKASKFTAEQYGTKVSVEVDHSDMELDEVMDVFQTLLIGMGYHENSFKNWVIDRADEYIETDAEDLKEKLEAWKFEDDDNDFFGGLDFDEKRMDIIGQNGNEGLHYRATQEDEDEFSNDGGFDGKAHFEWGDEPEDDNLFEGDEWKPNQKMAEANERYKKEVKKMNSKKRNNKD